MKVKKQSKLNLREFLDIENKFPQLAHLSHEDLVELKYRQGDLTSWKLDSAQKDLKEFLLTCTELISIAAISRQTGKSYFATVTAFEFCLTNPNVVVKYCAADAKQAFKAIRGNIMNLVGECPEDLRPKFKQQLGGWEFKNGSMLYLEGADNGKIDNLRGTPAHLIIVDEAAFIDNLSYGIGSVLLPMLLTTNGRIFMISTPPKTKAHDFMDFVNLCKENNAYFELDIYAYLERVKDDHPHFKQRISPAFVEILRRTSTPSHFQREYLLRYDTDMEDAVIPEFTKDLQKNIIKHYTRPKIFHPYVAMDLAGVRDLNAIVFGYYDPIADLTIVEDEIELKANQTNSDILGKAIKAMEVKLWGDQFGSVNVPVKRYCDINEAIAVRDLQRLHGLKFVTIPKDDKHAAIENLKTQLYNEKIIIQPNCRNTIFHLEGAIWDKTGKSFKRHVKYGHYDFVDAMVYFARAVKRRKITTEDEDNYANQAYYHVKPKESKNATVLKKLFSPKIRRFK